jgi:hypothetical protein
MNANDKAPRPEMIAAVEQGEAAALLGEFAALLQRLGSPTNVPNGRAAVAPSTLLDTYQTRVLAPIELPAIARASLHAARGEWREILLLDSQLATEPLLAPFADGSRQIGRVQLERLRPLRDERVARRYLAAVESGQAHGWHTIVYGIMLAVYSWPLRQGLIHYGRQTIAGLAAAVGGASAPDDTALRGAVDHALAGLNGSYISSIASP